MHRERFERVRGSFLRQIQDQKELIHQKSNRISLEEKRERKYASKFGYRIKQISKKCPSGSRMGTPAPSSYKGERSITKYLRKDEVSIKQ